VVRLTFLHTFNNGGVQTRARIIAISVCGFANNASSKVAGSGQAERILLRTLKEPKRTLVVRFDWW
jgi:hypothetical protein